MATVIVYCDVKETFEKDSVERDLFWHDPIKHELIEFRGGQLEFEYVEDPYLVKMGAEARSRLGINSTYRLLPKVSELKVVNYNKVKINTNKNEVSKFFSDYEKYGDTEIVMDRNDDYVFIFSVPEREVDDFTYQLERNGFRFSLEK